MYFFNMLNWPFFEDIHCILYTKCLKYKLHYYFKIKLLNTFIIVSYDEPRQSKRRGYGGFDLNTAVSK